MFTTGKFKIYSKKLLLFKDLFIQSKHINYKTVAVFYQLLFSGTHTTYPILFKGFYADFVIVMC